MSAVLTASDLLSKGREASHAIETLLSRATETVRQRVSDKGRLSPALLESEQRAAHGLAWLATYAQAIRELAAWGERLNNENRLTETEALIIGIGIGEYLAQIYGGIPMSQGEMVRLEDLDLPETAIDASRIQAVRDLLRHGNTVESRALLIKQIRAHQGAACVGDPGLDDTLESIRDEMRKFAAAEVEPFAHEWHRKNDYIPMSVIEGLAGMGVFGLTLPEEYGGMGLGKVSMCVVSEELSRAYIGVGSLGTRSEIAAELILCGGTEEQKNEWLPKIGSGEILPTAVFTEPNTGSDLASLRTRAIREGDVYKITGNKTWITHPVRADLMTMLVRTNPDDAGYKGLSILLAPKPRGTDADPFPATGMTGGEIEVLGYRGMKEYELAFDGFEVPAANLLGGEEGQGFKHLMQTFESARIQTAARAVGVAQSAFDIGLRYAEDRQQFGKSLIAFPRVADKLAMMAVEIAIARQMT